jgi:hypothetical protein
MTLGRSPSSRKQKHESALRSIREAADKVFMGKVHPLHSASSATIKGILGKKVDAFDMLITSGSGKV